MLAVRWGLGDVPEAVPAIAPVPVPVTRPPVDGMPTDGMDNGTADGASMEADSVGKLEVQLGAVPPGVKPVPIKTPSGVIND